MRYNPQFYFNPDDGSSLCIITTKQKTFFGTAQCADFDRDMMSEKTGSEIAYHRAVIKFLQSQREEVKNELQGLKKYYYTICQSKYFEEDSYATNMLKRQIKMRENDLIEIKNMILDEKEFLINYMKKKSDFYHKIRNKRGQNQ